MTVVLGDIGPSVRVIVVVTGRYHYIDKDFSVSHNFIVLMVIVVFIIVFVLKIDKYGIFTMVWKNWRNGTW